MKYNQFRYYFPPRAESRITSDQLEKYVKEYLAQPKLNGSCCEIYISPEGDVRNFGRHKNENLTNFQIDNEELAKLNTTGKWMVLVGEYMNKNKKGLDGKPWNHNFVIFDILVYEDDYMVGSTFQSRVELLDKIFGTTDYNKYLYKISDNVYRVKTFYDDFTAVWKGIESVDTKLKKDVRANKEDDIFILEGLVLKKELAKLERGFREKNNTLSQVKARIGKRNYHF